MQGIVLSKAVFIPGVLFKNRMKIGPPKSKGAYSRPAGISVWGGKPRARFRINKKRGVFYIHFRERLIYIDGGRQYPVIKGKGRFDKPCRTCRSLCMSDLGLHAAKGDVLFPVIIRFKNGF